MSCRKVYTVSVNDNFMGAFYTLEKAKAFAALFGYVTVHRFGHVRTPPEAVYRFEKQGWEVLAAFESEGNTCDRWLILENINQKFVPRTVVADEDDARVWAQTIVRREGEKEFMVVQIHRDMNWGTKGLNAHWEPVFLRPWVLREETERALDEYLQDRKIDVSAQCDFEGGLRTSTSAVYLKTMREHHHKLNIPQFLSLVLHIYKDKFLCDETVTNLLWQMWDTGQPLVIQKFNSIGEGHATAVVYLPLGHKDWTYRYQRIWIDTSRLLLEGDVVLNKCVMDHENQWKEELEQKGYKIVIKDDHCTYSMQFSGTCVSYSLAIVYLILLKRDEFVAAYNRDFKITKVLCNNAAVLNKRKVELYKTVTRNYLGALHAILAPLSQNENVDSRLLVKSALRYMDTLKKPKV